MAESRVDSSALKDVVTSSERRQHYRDAGYWTSQTLADRLAEHAQRTPDKVAVVDLGGARRKTFGELYTDVRRAVAMLEDLSVSDGDVVAVQLPNWYETVVIDLAVLARGAVLNTMLPIYRGKELRHMLSAAGTKLLITPGIYRKFDHAELAAELAADLPALTAYVVVPDPTESPDAFADILVTHAAAPFIAGQDPEAVSELLFTSGTESTPKAVMHTESTTGFGVRAAAEHLGITVEDIVWMPSPIGHSTGFNYGVRMAIHHGLTLCLQDRWDAAEAVSLIAAERCSYTVAATTFLNDVVTEALRTGADMSSMRLFSSGGAPVPSSLVRQASSIGMTVLRLYGSTEILIGTWNRPDSADEKRYETDGAAFPGVELEVRGVDGVPVTGEAGEIFVRSPSASVGFFDDPERTARTFAPTGWIATGDLGILDADGYLTIVGRSKEIIIRGGLNVAPREIEEMIQGLPGVAACAVVPLPHARLGEISCACVVLDAQATLTFEALIDALKSQGLANFKLPERLEILDALPTTSTGKIQKHVLVQNIASESLVD
ncbi:AMP-binding protein [Rhodococcus sp. NPDC059968]|uniref:AMP-binding protein n=1 Tax=Rhodococcus sp. NPDC059968 TaxID=3347017 RepID=UPI00366F09A6